MVAAMKCPGAGASCDRKVRHPPCPTGSTSPTTLPYLVNRLGSALVESFTASALAQHNLNIDTWRVMAVLANQGAQRQIDLAGMTSIEVSTLSRLVTRMVRMGLGDAPALGDLEPRGRCRAWPRRARASSSASFRSRNGLKRRRAPGSRPTIWRWSSARCGGCSRICRDTERRVQVTLRSRRSRCAFGNRAAFAWVEIYPWPEQRWCYLTTSLDGAGDIALADVK